MARTFRTAVATAAPYITHEAVNLDGATTDPADLIAYAETLKELANYAEHKATAMRFRAARAGECDIVTAMAHEGMCNRIYDNLPEWARW